MFEYPEDIVEVKELTDSEIKTVQKLARASAMIMGSYISAIIMAVLYGIFLAISSFFVYSTTILLMIPIFSVIIAFAAIYTVSVVQCKKIGKSNEWHTIEKKLEMASQDPQVLESIGNTVRYATIFKSQSRKTAAATAASVALTSYYYSAAKTAAQIYGIRIKRRIEYMAYPFIIFFVILVIGFVPIMVYGLSTRFYETDLIYGSIQSVKTCAEQNGIDFSTSDFRTFKDFEPLDKRHLKYTSPPYSVSLYTDDARSHAEFDKHGVIYSISYTYEIDPKLSAEKNYERAEKIFTQLNQVYTQADIPHTTEELLSNYLPPEDFKKQCIESNLTKADRFSFKNGDITSVLYFDPDEIYHAVKDKPTVN